MTVIVEGVKTEEQWNWLAAYGAGYVQGCFFAKLASPSPVPTYT